MVLIAIVEGIRLIHVPGVTALQTQITQAKIAGYPAIIWQAGEDAPLWWSEG